MIRYCCLLVIVWITSYATGVSAQSKLVPVSKSELLRINLPAGSKQDKRFLSIAAAQTLLDMEAKDHSIVLSELIEVFSLPASSAKESEKFVLQEWKASGWNMTPLPNPNYYVLTQSGSALLVYLQTFAKETALYVCKIESMPTDKAVDNLPPQQTEQPVQQPTSVSQPERQQSVTTAVSSPKPASPAGFTFTTTNFDDGWTATVQENWVEVVKGNVRVLLHYHTRETSEYISDYRMEDRLAWNTFIVPRYGNINYTEGPGVVTFERPHYLHTNAVEPNTSKQVYLVLFSMGKSGWIEFITPDKNTFVQTFGLDVNQIDLYSIAAWDPLRKMSGYNKFAVGAGDLTGKWSSSFSGFTSYVNVYTGADAGTNTHSSAESFIFHEGGSYEWSLGVASGMIGNIKFSNVASKGNLTMPNPWQIHFSEIEKKARLYNAYFSCVRGGARLLWLQDTGYGDYKAFGKE